MKSKSIGELEDKETAEKHAFLRRLSTKFIEPHDFHVWIFEDGFVELHFVDRALQSWTSFDKCLFTDFSIFNWFRSNTRQFTYWTEMKSRVPSWIQTLADVKSLEELKLRCMALGVFDDLFA